MLTHHDPEGPQRAPSGFVPHRSLLRNERASVDLDVAFKQLIGLSTAAAALTEFVKSSKHLRQSGQVRDDSV